MAHGKSGKIIIEVDPAFKERIYATLTEQGSTMKDWFLSHAVELCDEHHQPSLQLVAEATSSYSSDNPSQG